MSARITVFLLACMACGTRTGLPVGVAADSSAPPPPPGGCTAPRPARPLRVSASPSGDQPLDVLTVLASAGCSYATAWTTGESDVSVQAATFHVVDGAWRASPVVTVAHVGNYFGSAWITWNGTAYVVVWDDGSRLDLRTMAEDGTPLGEPKRLFAFPETSVIEGLEADEDGVVRIGMGLAVRPNETKGYFGRVTIDGQVLLPPTLVTPPETFGNATFLFEASGAHEVLNVASQAPSVTESLSLSSFDDDGHVSSVTTLSTLTNGSSFALGAHGLATSGSDLYYAWAQSNGTPPFAVFLEDRSSGVPLRLPRGGAPELATLGNSTLGVLTTPIGAGDELGLVLVNDGVAGPEAPVASIPSTESVSSFSMSAGRKSVGVAWGTSDAVYFTVAEP